MQDKIFNGISKLKLFKKFFKKNPRIKFIQRLYSKIRFLRKERFITALNIFFKEGQNTRKKISMGWISNKTFFIYCPNFQYAKSTFYIIKDSKQRDYDEFFKALGSKRKKILISNSEIVKADNHIFTFELVKKLVEGTVIKRKKTNINDYLEHIIKYRKGNIKTYNFYSVHFD